MHQYLDLVEHTLYNGVVRDDRTGTGTISVFGTQTRYPLEDSFPLLTTKKIHFRSVLRELLWFLRGETNIHTLKSKIWHPWADANGELGPIYGSQWRNWNGDGIDQIANVIEDLRLRPNSRRHIVTAWNPSKLPHMALPPCHMIFQFYIAKEKLSCHMYQRSADLALGVPFNIASYALLTCMIANELGLKPAEFIHTIGDCHIYSNHIDAMIDQLARSPYPCPKLILPQNKPVDEIIESDIRLLGYRHYKAIPLKIAV